MSNTSLPAILETALRRGLLVDKERGFIVRVLSEDGTSEDMECDVLQTSAAQLVPDPGDEVLVWRPAPGERAIILGRVARHQLDGEGSNTSPSDELTIEARRSLTLRVGQGSIAIREDGKILIKGKDLVSHATRLNRIRGGSVSIN
jgi:hypothetical protein